MEQEQRKFLVIGLDGAEPELILKWTAEGKLPNISRLMDRGVFSTLRSTYPPISAAAWVTFMTGQNPAQHGVFDFRNFAPWKYSGVDEQIVSSRDFAGKTIIDVVNYHGRQVAAVTVPITYPAWEIDGAMVSGYPTPDSRKAFTYPPELAQRVGHLTEDSAFFRSKSQSQVLKELKRLVQDRTAASIDIWTQYQPGLMVLVLGSTDRAHHDYWRHFQVDYPTHDPQEAVEFGSAIEEVYRESDLAIGDLLQAVDDETVVMVISDHGGGPRPTRRFNTNAWLRHHGFLATKAEIAQSPSAIKRLYRSFRSRFPYQEQIYRRLPQLLKRLASQVDASARHSLGQVDWSNTNAYRFPLHPPIDGIEINLNGRQLQGTVEQEAYHEKCQQILSLLREIRDPATGERVVVEAFHRDELYQGEKIELAPDIIFELNPAFEGASGFAETITPVPLDELRQLSGTHRMDGILIAAGPGLQVGSHVKGARLMDIAPTVIFGMGLPIPRFMEGKVLTDIFQPNIFKERAIEFSDWGDDWNDADDISPYSKEDEDVIREKLRRLGYLE